MAKSDEVFPSSGIPNQHHRNKVGLFQDRPLAIVFLLCVLGLAVILASLYYLAQKYLDQSVIHVAARYSEAMEEFRTTYTSEVVARVVAQGIEVTHDYQDRPGQYHRPTPFPRRGAASPA